MHRRLGPLREASLSKRREERASDGPVWHPATRGVARPEDPCDPREDDPAQCRALESSLWEVLALRRVFDGNHHFSERQLIEPVRHHSAQYPAFAHRAFAGDN